MRKDSSGALNYESSQFVQIAVNDGRRLTPHNGSMESNQPDWFLRDWLSHFKKRQSSLSNELGWTKGRANYVYHSQAPYHRDTVNEIASWLGIRPFELLTHPDEATALRRLRETAALIVAETTKEFVRDAPPQLAKPPEKLKRAS